MSGLKEKILKEIPEIEKSVFTGSEEITGTRKKAKDFFETFGFPNKKMEDWRFTNINSIISNDFDFAEDGQLVDNKIIENFLIPGLKANVVVLINGMYSPENSKIISGNKSLKIKSFNEALKTNKKILEKYFAKYADYKTDGFTALNTAFSNDGTFISIDDNFELTEPVLIMNISDAREKKIMNHPRNLIIAGRASKANIIEAYFSLGDKDAFSNTVTEIYMNENSSVQYYKIQDEEINSYHIGTAQVFQEKASEFHSVTISWGASVIRNNLNSYLNGENIECTFKGLYYLTGKQHVDNHTLADHASPNCHSNEFYKGIIDDEADGVFNGKIMVRKDAQKTNAYQMNKNILLSNEAKINSKPQLEIYADDVKCSHGATTGQIDREQIFYLKSRGIGENEGKRLLLYAFANEILEEIKIDELKEHLEKKLSDKLENK